MTDAPKKLDLAGMCRIVQDADLTREQTRELLNWIIEARELLVVIKSDLIIDMQPIAARAAALLRRLKP